MARRHTHTTRKAPAKRKDERERAERVDMLAGRLSNDTHYWSESKKELVPIAWMPIPHAEHALAKLERQYGDEVHETPLAQALQRRVGQGGDVTEVAPSDDTRMMRAGNGQFTGAIKITRRKRV